MLVLTAVRGGIVRSGGHDLLQVAAVGEVCGSIATAAGIRLQRVELLLQGHGVLELCSLCWRHRVARRRGKRRKTCAIPQTQAQDLAGIAGGKKMGYIRGAEDHR